jgi:glycosyltransferase involved in cell wall biosynthesis
MLTGKLFEYLGSGHPVLATLEGEGACIVEEARAGIVVPAEDSSALAMAVLNMSLMPPSEREAMGQNGRLYFLQECEQDTLLIHLDS